MAIEQVSFRSPRSAQVFLEELSRPWAHVDVVREPEQHVVAFCNYWLVADEVHLLNVATHPGAALGHASRLLRSHPRLRPPGVPPGHPGGSPLERRGAGLPSFRLQAGRLRPNYYADDHEDAIVMLLDLV